MTLVAAHSDPFFNTIILGHRLGDRLPAVAVTAQVLASIISIEAMLCPPH